MDQVKEQVQREPKPFPTIKLNPLIKNIDDFTLEDITLENYDPHPALRAEIANIGGFDDKVKKDFTFKDKKDIENQCYGCADTKKS